MSICQYCNREFSADECKSFAGHVVTCKFNPKWEVTKEKIRQSRTQVRQEFEVLCKCGNKFVVETTQNNFDRGKYRKNCSRSCANGRVHSKEWNEKIRTSLVGKQIAERLTVLCVICGDPIIQIGVSKPRTCSRKCAAKLAGQTQSSRYRGSGKLGGYRRGSGRWKGQYYKDSWMDSSWEVEFAKRLDQLNIVWTRHVETFSYVHSSGMQRRYFPDFFLPDFNLFIEIKGMIDENVEPKLQAVRDANRMIIILMSLKEIHNFELALSSKGRMQGPQPCDGGFKSP